MRKWGLVLLILFFVSSLPAHGQAATVYVTQTGGPTGNCTGSPLLSAAAFNTTSSWGTGASQIGPGTTILICGNITTTLNFQASGVSGKPITLKFDAGAVMSSPVWPWLNGAINSGGYSYLVIDGGTNGIIQNTANGIGLANQAQTTAIQLGAGSGNSSNIEVKNLTCANMFIMYSGATWPSGLENTHLNCVYDGGSGGNISIHDNVMHDVSWAINFQGNAASSGVSIYGNEIYNFDHGFALGLDGCSPSCSATNVSFHDNHVHDPANWDDPSDYNHHDGVHIYANGGSGTMTVNGVSIYNNLFDGNWGMHYTAQLWCQYDPGTLENFNVYNNVFAMPNDGNPGGNGLVTCGTNAGTNHIVNNTFIGNPGTHRPSYGFSWSTSDGILSGGTVDVQNNSFVNIDRPVYIQSAYPVALNNWDHNIYQDSSGFWEWTWNSTNYSTFAAFQNACGCDLIGSSAASGSFITALGLPSSGSPVLNAGTNLCGVLGCTSGLAALSSDTSAGDTRTPIQRPTGTTAWDVGAYQVSNLSLPAAPTGLTATVQ